MKQGFGKRLANAMRGWSHEVFCGNRAHTGMGYPQRLRARNRVLARKKIRAADKRELARAVREAA